MLAARRRIILSEMTRYMAELQITPKQLGKMLVPGRPFSAWFFFGITGVKGNGNIAERIRRQWNSFKRARGLDYRPARRCRTVAAAKTRRAAMTMHRGDDCDPEIARRIEEARHQKIRRYTARAMISGDLL